MTTETYTELESIKAFGLNHNAKTREEAKDKALPSAQELLNDVMIMEEEYEN